MQKRFDVLDSFRGIAAVIIIVHHIHYQNSIAKWNFFINAELFVGMFFVLSGFVLTHSYAFKTTLDFKKFFMARTFRIFPLHVFMLISIALIVPLTGYNALANFPVHLVLLQSWIPNTGNIGFNAPAWSISVEYYMYMIFFVSLLLTRKKRKVVWAIIVISTLFLLISQLVTLGYLIHVVRGLFSFFLGSLVYLLYKNYSNNMKNLSKVYYSIAEVLIVSLIIYIVSSTIENKFIIIYFLFAFQMFIFAFEKGFISTLLKKSFFLHIGKLSYSIYLIHYFILLVIHLASNVLERYGFPVTEVLTIYPNLTILCIVLTVIYVSKYTYLYIELKGQNLGKKLYLK